MFLDIPLAYELVLMIALVAFISWFTGRVFCKSKEYQVNTYKKSLEVEKTYLASGLNEKDKEVQVLTFELRDYQRQVSDLTHQHDLNINCVNVLKKEQKKALIDLQKSSAYQTKLDQLNKQYEEQSKQLSSLLIEGRVDKEVLQQNIGVIKKQKQQWDEVAGEKQQLAKEIIIIEKKLKQQLEQEKTYLQGIINTQTEKTRTLQHTEEEKQHQLNLKIQKKVNVIDILEKENNTLKKQQGNEQLQREILLIEKKALEKLNAEKILSLEQQTKDINVLKEVDQENKNKFQKNITLIKQQNKKIKKELKQTLEQEKIRLEEVVNHNLHDMQDLQRKHEKNRYQLNLTLQEKDHVIDVLQQKYSNIETLYAEKTGENKKRKINEKQQQTLIFDQKQLNIKLEEEKKSLQNKAQLMQKKTNELELIKTQKERLEKETLQQQKTFVALQKNYTNKQKQYQQKADKFFFLKKQHATEIALKETLQQDKQDLASRYATKKEEIETQNRLISRLRKEKKTLVQTNAQQMEEITAFNQERARQLALTNEKLTQML